MALGGGDGGRKLSAGGTARRSALGLCAVRARRRGFAATDRPEWPRDARGLGAVRQLDALGLRDRGLLREGMFADVVVFDDKTIIDLATPDKPHQISRGVEQVFVNGVQVLRDGQHTGAKPGRVLKCPGAR